MLASERLEMTECSEIVNFLLDHGVRIHARDRDGSTPLHNASSIGQTAIARLLLGRGTSADVEDKDGSTPLQLATPELFFGNTLIVIEDVLQVEQRLCDSLHLSQTTRSEVGSSDSDSCAQIGSTISLACAHTLAVEWRRDTVRAELIETQPKPQGNLTKINIASSRAAVPGAETPLISPSHSHSHYAAKRKCQCTRFRASPTGRRLRRH